MSQFPAVTTNGTGLSGIPGTMTRTSLLLPDGLPFAQWEEVGRILEAMETGHQWWIGDWLRYGERGYGEMYTQAIEATGRDYQTLNGYKWVAGQIEPMRRRIKLSWSHHREIAALSSDEQERWLDAAEEHDWTRADLRKRLRGNGLAVHFASDSTEWYTPPEIISATVAALGAIDLDPCSNSRIAPNVPASRHYIEADNGLVQDWHGRVYMNPPYGRDIGLWVEKLAEEYAASHVTEAVALIPARVDTAWFRRLPADYVCFIDGRLTFSEHESAAPFPSCVAYLGQQPERFIAAFESEGRIYRRVTGATGEGVSR